MIWFGVPKSITSSVRWILGLVGLVLIRPTLLTPPFFRTQVLWLPLASRKFLKLGIGSYYDWATIHEVFVRGEYDIRTFKTGADAFQKGRSLGDRALILDLGCNVGVSMAFFASQFMEARVIGVEPSEANVRLARSNTRSVNAEVLHAAIANESGEIEVFDTGLGNNAFRTFGAPGTALSAVKAVTVDEILTQNSDHVPFLVKIDIEGFEQNLFANNVEWLDRFDVLVIETHDWMLPNQAISSNLLKALGGRNRDLVFKGENLFSFRNN
jgi:FkbM family methyltransferase